MPDATLALLAAYLWDLRAQCENKLRELTEAQRLVNGQGAEVDLDVHQKERLLRKLDLVILLDSEALTIARACREVAAELRTTGE